MAGYNYYSGQLHSCHAEHLSCMPAAIAAILYGIHRLSAQQTSQKHFDYGENDAGNCEFWNVPTFV